MKVLLANGFLYRNGGSEAVFFNTADLLLAAGHEVVLFGRESPQNIPYPAPVYTCRSWSGRFEKIRRAVSYFYNKDAAKCLEEVILKERPDIVHVHLFWGSLSPSIIDVVHKYGIPIVHTTHDYRMLCPAYNYLNGKGEVCSKCTGGHFVECFKGRCSKGHLIESFLMYKEMVHRNRKWHPAKVLDGIIYVSQFSRAKHMEVDPLFRGINDIVMYNTTDLASIYPDLPVDKGYYLYFGRLSPEKGIQLLADTVRSMPSIKLLIVGTGPLEDYLKDRYSGCDNIEFLGYRTGDDLYGLVRGARFVCVPSECYENNPMTIVEAYSLGVPVIGADYGGITEIVENGRTGLLFETRNSDSLKHALLTSMELSDEQYHSLRVKARRFAELHFNPQEYIKRLLDFYEETIDRYKKINKS